MFGKDTQHCDATGLVRGMTHIVVTKVGPSKTLHLFIILKLIDYKLYYQFTIIVIKLP